MGERKVHRKFDSIRPGVGVNPLTSTKLKVA